MKSLVRAYKLKSTLASDIVLARVKDLLSSEGVEAKAADLHVISTRIPVVTFALQPTFYSRKNWVGLNPFTFISALEVICAPDSDGETEVEIRVNRRRSILLALCWGLFALPIARMLDLYAGAIFLVGVSVMAWLFNVVFFAGYLIRKEIQDSIKPSSK